MAHKLSFNNGKAEMAYSGETPWHNLGTRVEGLQTAVDMLRHAGLLWTVGTYPIYSALDSVNAVPGFRAIHREDNHKVLGIVSDRYAPIQNTQAGDMMDALVAEGNAHVEVAGALDDGQRLWMLAHIPADFEVVKGDTVKPYVLLAWGHDGKHGLAAKLTPIRVVCDNTLTSALGDKWSKTADVYVKHTKTAVLRIEEAQRALGLIRTQVEQTAEAYQALAAKRLTADQAAGYFSTVFPQPDESIVRGPANKAPDARAHSERYEEAVERWIAQQERLGQLYHEGAGSEMATGTAWGAYNAVTEYVDHVYPVLQSGKVSQARLQSAVLGSYADVKGRALQEALTLA